jgi:DNA polymerase I-like protein with 3'-5' exonuclease and polymerase domains
VYRLLITAEEVQSLIEWHNANSETVTVDTETTGLDVFKDRVVDIQMEGREPDEVCIFKAEFAYLLPKLTSRPIGSYLSFDIKILYHSLGVNCLEWQFYDIGLLGHLADENRESYSLQSFEKDLFGDDRKTDFWEKYENYEAAPEAERYEYGATDILRTRKVYEHLRKSLRDQSIPDSLVVHVHRLASALLETEVKGVKVDLDYLAKIGVEFKLQIDTLGPQIREQAKDYVECLEYELWEKAIAKLKTPKGKARVPKPQFSPGSSKQLQSLLYDVMGLPPQRNAKTKNISVDADSLDRIKDLHPVLPTIIKYKEYPTIYNTFIVGTLEKSRGGRIYPRFHADGTKTGRTSSSDPNLQNLPRAGGIRGIYVPDPGYSLISADYESLEIFIAANFTKDPSLMRVVLNGESLHDVTAKSVGIERQLAKTLNFAEGYGCSHHKVKTILKCSEKEAMRIHEAYWKTYSGQKKLMDECSKRVDDGLPIVTRWGRKRRFEIQRRSPWDKAYRQAWNFLIQSSGADCCNKAYYTFNERLKNNGRGRAWFPLHDEVIAQVKTEYAEEESRELCRIMTEAGDDIGLEVRLKAVPSDPSDRWMD